MFIHKKYAAALAALSVILGVCASPTVEADGGSDIITKTVTESGTATETNREITQPETETVMQNVTETETETVTQSVAEAETEAVTPNVTEAETEAVTQNVTEAETEAVTQNITEADTEAETGTFTGTAAKPEIDTLPDELQAFEACLEYSTQGWMVKGTLKNLASDTIRIQPMCATDGENYYDCGQGLDLNLLDVGNGQFKLQNLRCLYDSEEPLKSYLAKKLDRFSIKLRIVRTGGISYETQAAVIDRGGLSDMPGEFHVAARFADSMLVREGRPPNIRYYGRYQITVSEDATAKEVTGFLPDTLPVEVHLLKGIEDIGSDIVECRVKWKPLGPLQLAAQKSMTVMDAAEALIIPAGTVLHTQTGIYRMNDPVEVGQDRTSDDVQLVLNAVAKDAPPTGVLSEENHGLEMAFDLKPTGATAIRAFTFTQDRKEWVEISSLSLTDIVDMQPLTASSGYAVVLGKEQEPYRSYRESLAAGKEPVPFFVGLKMEGGVYDGKELVLAWPDTYDLPLHLPQMGGSGGNQGNAGSDDKQDSTEQGQRPVLPKEPIEEGAPAFGEPPEETPTDQPVSGQAGGPVKDREPVFVPDGNATAGLSDQPVHEPPVPKPSQEPGEKTVASMETDTENKAGTKSSGKTEEGVPDGVLNGITETVLKACQNGGAPERTHIQQKSARTSKNTGNRALFWVTAGIVIGMGVGIAVIWRK